MKLAQHLCSVPYHFCLPFVLKGKGRGWLWGILLFFGPMNPTLWAQVEMSLESPLFSLEPGFYASAQQLILTSSADIGFIHFTLDGSEPTRRSKVYSTPLRLSHTTVIKAVTVHENKVSEVRVGTFFIDEKIAPLLPVISLSTDSTFLFDTLTGVYTRGPKSHWNDAVSPAGYWKRIEFAAHFEFFNLERERVVAQALGARIFGNYSREHQQKSFRLSARKKYGKSRLNYNFFPDLDRFEYKHLVLRNAGTDWNFGHLRDGFIHEYVKDQTHLDVQASRPCVVFLNGVYWGVYHLREYMSPRVIADKYGYDPKEINLLEYNHEVKEGSNADFIELEEFVLREDLTQTAVFDSLEKELDVQNLTDYWAVEIWAANSDWMESNVRFWNERTYDTPWRYILWDLDWGLGLGRPHAEEINFLKHYLAKEHISHVWMLRKMLSNENYKRYFITRNADLLNTLFVPDAVFTELDLLVSMMEPEMTRHFGTWGAEIDHERWGKGGHGSAEEWLHSNVKHVRDFVLARQQAARDHLQWVMELEKQTPIYIEAFPTGAGRIQVNTVEIAEFPWEGIYFQGIPITLTALPNPGYEFSHWQQRSPSDFSASQQTLTLDLTAMDSITAYFSGFPATPVITLNEFCTQSSGNWDTDDWIELYNPGSVPFELSNWRLKDEQNQNRFVFPEGTQLAPGSYLVVARDPEAFSAVHPEVTELLGPTTFGLSKKQGQVRLIRPNLEEYMRVTYSELGSGTQSTATANATYELIDPMLNPGTPEHWQISQKGGSPGRANAGQ